MSLDCSGTGQGDGSESMALLLRMARAVRLLVAGLVLTGISPTISRLHLEGRLRRR